jgi:hypothetical protein
LTDLFLFIESKEKLDLLLRVLMNERGQSAQSQKWNSMPGENHRIRDIVHPQQVQSFRQFASGKLPNALILD